MMSSPYFLVHRVAIAEGFALVDGRLGDAKIKKGHVFSRSYVRLDAWRSEKNEFQSCAFVLSEIEAYRHTLEELDGGMTARLRIEGENLDSLATVEVLA